MKDLRKWKLKWKILFSISIVCIISGVIWLSVSLGISFPTVYDECGVCPP
jgi:hypothetical protein